MQATTQSTGHFQLKQAQRLLVGHGALILLLGFIIGFGFLFFLNGEISLWPFGRFEYQLPGTYDAWRMAHMEGILNGFGLWLSAAILPVLQLPTQLLRLVTWGFIVTAWTIVIASAFDPLFANARGLIFNEQTNFANDIAFFLFYIGILAVIIVVVVIAVQAFKK